MAGSIGPANIFLLYCFSPYLPGISIPAIKIGPRGKNIGPRLEEIKIDDMVKAAQIYALVALDICNRDRPRAG